MDLKREWDSLDEADIQTVDLPASEREALIEFYKEIYSNGDKVLLRHDYKELLEVSLKLHGPSCQQEFTWKKVGAVNKARFMAWSLCSVKAFAFSSGLLQGNQGKPAMLHSLPSHNLHSSLPDVQHLI